jgi:hypothetical protein
VLQETQLRLKLNETQQFLSYADDVNLLGDNIDNVNKSRSLIEAASSKKFGLEINVDKYVYILMSRHQNAFRNRDIKIAKR